MPVRARHLAVVATLVLLGGGLTGCGTINEKIADGAGDYVPQWMGGLPADAPPRPGTAKYDEFMKEQERKRLEVKVKDDAAAAATSTPTTSSSGLSAVH
jgi:hypothetical protein